MIGRNRTSPQFYTSNALSANLVLFGAILSTPNSFLISSCGFDCRSSYVIASRYFDLCLRYISKGPHLDKKMLSAVKN